MILKDVHNLIFSSSEYITLLVKKTADWSKIKGFSGGSDGKESACNAGNPGSIPGSGRSSEKEWATHSSIFIWEFPWTEESGGLQSMGSLSD